MKPYFETENGTIYHGDCIKAMQSLPEKSVHCCVTSPPYFGLRDYGHDGQIGLEQSPDEYVAKMVEVFREVRRVLRDDGVCWANLGDTYAANRGYQVPDNKHCDVGNSKGMNAGAYNLKPKDLIGIPWRVAFALQADGWWLRQDIIWHKPSPLPESVTDRCTKAHEYIFLLSKSARYYYDAEAVKEIATSVGYEDKELHSAKPGWSGAETAAGQTGHAKPGGWQQGKGRNRRSVWTVATQPFKGSHFAVFPQKLIEPCILAGCPESGTVLDPFFGSGTTGVVAYNHGRKFIGIDLSEAYLRDIAVPRIEKETQQLRLFR